MNPKLKIHIFWSIAFLALAYAYTRLSVTAFVKQQQLNLCSDVIGAVPRTEIALVLSKHMRKLEGKESEMLSPPRGFQKGDVYVAGTTALWLSHTDITNKVYITIIEFN